MSKEFVYNKLILEHHLDTFGHVNNATYLELYEEARWDFLEQNGFGLRRIQEQQQGPVILELNLSFQKELINREEISIVSHISEIKKNGLITVMNQKMIKSGQVLASELNVTFALMDLKKRKLMKPTDEWMAAIGISKD